MIEFLVLLLGVYGTLAAPHTLHQDHDVYHGLNNDAELVGDQLPGTENLHEKALPISRLLAVATTNQPTSNNLAEKSQVPQRLPGTGNLAEKRIPDVVLKRLQLSDIK